MNESNNNQKDSFQDPEIPAELRAALDDWQTPIADAGFRARQRHAFLAAGKAGGPPSEEEAGAQLDSRQTEPAREGFRTMLRERFLAAAGEYREDYDESSHELRPLAGGAPARPQPQLGMPKLLVGVLALAAAGLLYFGMGSNALLGPLESMPQDPSFPGWQTVNFVHGDEVVLDGNQRLSGSDERLGAALTLGGCSLETGGGKLSVIHYGEGVLLEFPPGTELRFPPVPKGERGLIEIVVERGGVRVATTDEFMGRILVHTPHTTIALSGPSMGIDVVEEGTCVCALAGDAQIRPLKEQEGSAGGYNIGSGRTSFVRRSGAVVEFPEGDVHHSKELENFAELGNKYLY